MMYKKTLLIYLLSASALLALPASMGCHHQEAHGETHHHGTPKLLVTTPEVDTIEVTRDYVAQIHASQHIELRAIEHGYLQDIFVDEGQHVKKGERMFMTTPVLYRAEVKKAKAEAKLASIEYENTRKLHDQNVVSTNEVALARARQDRAQADVDMAKAHLTMSEIHAPFDGIMNRLHVRRGSLLEEGELLTTLSDNSTVWVYFNVSEAEYLDYMLEHKNETQTPVKLLMANHKMFAHEGKVETIEADFHHETGNIAFRAAFPNPDGLLRHGETGKIIMSTSLSDALIIPQKATFEILDKKYVFVVAEDDTVHMRQITIAHELPHIYVVSEGLAREEKILVEGLRKVRDGAKIIPDIKPPKEVLDGLAVPAE